ncbi:hypothetical protein, partial [Leminorella grimontii]
MAHLHLKKALTIAIAGSLFPLKAIAEECIPAISSTGVCADAAQIQNQMETAPHAAPYGNSLLDLLKTDINLGFITIRNVYLLDANEENRSPVFHPVTSIFSHAAGGVSLTGKATATNYSSANLDGPLSSGASAIALLGDAVAKNEGSVSTGVLNIFGHGASAISIMANASAENSGTTSLNGPLSSGASAISILGSAEAKNSGSVSTGVLNIFGHGASAISIMTNASAENSGTA